MYLENNYSNFQLSTEEWIKDLKTKSQNLIQNHQQVISENQMIKNVEIPNTSVARTSSKSDVSHMSGISHDYIYIYTTCKLLFYFVFRGFV